MSDHAFLENYSEWIYLYRFRGLCNWFVICVGLIGESRSVSYDGIDDQAPTGPGEEKPVGDLPLLLTA